MSADEERKYVEEVGNAGAFSISPDGPSRNLPTSPILSDLGTIWNPQRFAVPRLPLSVGLLEDRARFSKLPTPRVSNVPVKFPGSDYRVPTELACAEEALRLCVAFEHAINPAVDEYYAYLTVDRDVIAAGYAQRGLDIHADFLQGKRKSPKTLCDHGYLCTDRDPPNFFDQPFRLTTNDVENDSYNPVFQRQARADCAVQVNPYEVVLFDAYCVHGAVPAAETAMRTFIRFFYSVSVYDRVYDGHRYTHNTLFDYHW